MPDQETAFRIHTAVLWEATGRNDANGEPEVSDTPTEIEVRWDGTRREVTDPQGRTVTADATAIVAQRIEVGSRMWRGTLATLPASFDSETQKQLTVISYDEVSDLKGGATYREVGLQRQTDVAP